MGKQEETFRFHPTTRLPSLLRVNADFIDKLQPVSGWMGFFESDPANSVNCCWRRRQLCRCVRYPAYFYSGRALLQALFDSSSSTWSGASPSSRWSSLLAAWRHRTINKTPTRQPVSTQLADQSQQSISFKFHSFHLSRRRYTL